MHDTCPGKVRGFFIAYTISVMKYVCKICGKSVGALGLVLDSSDNIPEVTKTVCFCSSRCANIFLGRIRAERTKKKKTAYKEQLLKNPERKASNDDLVAILRTLTKEQKDEMILHMMGICYARSDKTVKGILQVIDSLKDDRKEQRKFDVSDRP